MKKLFTFVLAGAMALSASARITYEIVTSPSELTSSPMSKFIVVAMAKDLNGGNFWTANKVLTHNGTTAQWVNFTTDVPAIADNILWTPVAHDAGCAETTPAHTNGVSFVLKTADNKYFKGATGGTSSTLETSADADGTALTFVPNTNLPATYSVPQRGSLHFRLSNSNRILGIKDNNTYGMFSHGNNPTCSSLLSRGFYAPDNSNHWGITFVFYKVTNLPDDQTMTLTVADGSFNATGNFVHTWTKAATETTPQVVLSAKQNGNVQSNIARQNCTDNTFQIFAGQNRPSEVVLSLGGNYYITGYSFKAVGASTNNVDILPQGANSTRINDTSTEHTVTVRNLLPGDKAFIQMTTANYGVNFTDITITYASYDMTQYNFLTGNAMPQWNALCALTVPEVAMSRYFTAINDAKVYVSNDRGGNLITSGGTKIHTATANINDPAQVWVIKSNAVDQTVKLYNPATKLWAKNAAANSVTADETQATSYKVAPSTYNANHLSLQNLSQTGNNYLNKQNSYVGYWSVDEGSTWSFTLIDPAKETAWRNEFKFYEYGTEPGKYYKPTATEEEYNAYQEAAQRQQASSTFIYDTYATIKAFENSWALYDLNTLAYPAMINLEYAFNQNLCSSHKKIGEANSDKLINNVNYRMIVQATTAANYILQNGKFYSYNTGRAIINNPANNGVMIHEDDNLSTNEGTQYTFGNVTVDNSKPNSAYWYSIKETGTSLTWGWSGSNLQFGTVAATPGSNYGYHIYYVNQISVEVDGQKFFRLPVAATFAPNDNITPYVISATASDNDDDLISTVQADENTVYAAGTGFILSGTGSITFNLRNNQAGDATYAAAIQGGHALKPYAATEGKIGLVVGVAEQPAQNQVRRRSTEVPSVEMTYIESHSALPAHAAVLEVTKTDNTVAGESLSVPLGDQITTGVKEIKTLGETSAQTVYDLQGRRLAAPVKGLNIINGQKVIVK